jgi:hypothetical protein
MRLADDDETPTWSDKPLPPDLDEMRTVEVLVDRVLKRQTVYPLPEKKLELLRGVQERLMAIQRRGTVAAEDRTWLLWNARLLLVTVF